MTTIAITALLAPTAASAPPPAKFTTVAVSSAHMPPATDWQIDGFRRGGLADEPADPAQVDELVCPRTLRRRVRGARAPQDRGVVLAVAELVISIFLLALLGGYLIGRAERRGD